MTRKLRLLTFSIFLIATSLVLLTGCGQNNPLAGKSEKEIEKMQADDQKKADDEEMEYNRQRKKKSPTQK